MGRFVMGRFVSGRFISGRFVSRLNVFGRFVRQDKTSASRTGEEKAQTAKFTVFARGNLLLEHRFSVLKCG